MRVVLLAACALTCWAATTDVQFNGRWDISVNGLSSPRGWWLEVSGAGTNNLKGKFVGAPVGQIDEIPKLSISDGELRFALQTRYRRTPAPEIGLYWARFEDGKLKGTFEIEGDPSSYLEWTGVRAPLLPDKDDGSWKKGDPVVLFDSLLRSRDGGEHVEAVQDVQEVCGHLLADLGWEVPVSELGEQMVYAALRAE